ncbi:PGF-CTERM sorting domain-containing protein [Halosimplex rubrum]|uniref:PGF-CTERM sorting domain-containing protein n=1 Tax=Halosimplex rubrum TaxID=869889 RepID=A0A7D5P7N4_9EURY|nr:CARDB domain-containing protein [Halosimplex rubrum]QLH75819.1 PGF-CTERM sorting domain-containing protein [Halosimplex rubrum]
MSVCVGFVGPVTALAPGSTTGALDEMAGSGTQDDPYQITNATELQAMNEDRGAHYVLVEDVDASATADWNLGDGFDPIGTVDERNAFTGTFDGRNHTITGLTIDRPSTNGVGLFATTDEATVEDVRFEGATSNGRRAVGVLAGRALATDVSGVSASGSVSAEARASGGLLGAAESTAIRRSHADVEVRGTELVAGLVGFSAEGSIGLSSASGPVTGTRKVGGLVGTNGEGNTVERSYATGSVSGDATVGGLVGTAAGGELSRSFATGAVDGDGPVGGLIGYSEATTADLYWDRDTSGTSVAVGEGSGSGTGLSTDRMSGVDARSNADSLAFGLVWTATDGYPILGTEVDSVDLSVPNQVITDRTTTATVRVSLAAGRTVTATETADYDTNQSFLSVGRGVLETSGTGTAELTAAVADHSDSAVVSVVTPPDISVESRSLRYDRVGSETAAPVDVTLTNDGGADGTFDVVLSINGTVEETRTVTVPGHSTTTVQLNYSAPAMGAHPVAVNGSSLGDLTVVEEPETSVASASVSESPLAVGNSTTVEATIDNAGDAAAGHTVELTADGETVATKTVVVPADGATVRFNYTGDSVGEYDLAVGGTSAGTLTVAELGSVSVESVSVPDSVEAGASYEVTVTVANSGGLALSSDVAYSVGGSAVGTEAVEVPADGATVSFEATAPEDSGSIDHSVTAGDAEWTGSSAVDVETPTPTATAGSNGDGGDGEAADGGSNDGGDATATSGDGPGFGAGAAVVALLALVAATRYRRRSR